MGRKMLKMERITNEKSHMTTYKKRKNCVFKKAWEFSTLCDVDTCVIVYGPNKSSGPEIWPEDRNKVQAIISRYRATAPSSSLKTYQLTDFFAARKKNIDSKIEKSRRETWKAKYRIWDEKLLTCSADQLRVLLVELEGKIQAVSNQISALETQKKARTVPEAPRSVKRESVCLPNEGMQYMPQAVEQQLLHLANPRQVDVPVFHLQDQLFPMSPSLAETRTTMMMLRGNNRFNRFSEFQYNPLMNRPVYFDPYWMEGNAMFSRANLFPGYYPVDPMAAQAHMAARLDALEERKNLG